MKITIEFKEPDKETNLLIFERNGWRTEGGPGIEMNSRTIWFMNQIQETFKEFKRRSSNNQSKS